MSEPLLEVGAGGVRGLRLSPLSIRVRLIAGGAENAIETRYDPYSPIELYFSDLQEEYLAGRIKVVNNFYDLKNTRVFASSSIVPAGGEKAQADANRRALRFALARQYFLAVARAVARLENMHDKRLKRLRYRANKELVRNQRGRSHPGYAPEGVDDYFQRWPAAIEAASEIRELINTV